MANEGEPNKVFVSYSWTTPDHEEWVLNLAQELSDRGVHVLIDKWDLLDGQDSNAYMERMVSDPTVTKVIMACDKMYAEKANGRIGGAGTEAQIMSPHVYASATQKKFLAVIREKDAEGKAYIPVYYGSRIYIDFTDDSQYAEKFVRLERWIADKPLHVRPPIGKRPAYLDEDAPVRMPTGVEHRRALEAIKSGKLNALVLADEYLRLVSTELKVFRLPQDKSGDADEIFSLIQQIEPVREEVVSVVTTLLRYQDIHATWEVIGAFLERLLAYDSWPEDVGSWHDCNADHFCFFIHELFLHLLGFALSERRFKFAKFLLNNRMLYSNRMRAKGDLVSFMQFRHHLTSLERINAKAKQKYHSLHAHMMAERAKHSTVKLSDVAQADFVAYLVSRRQFPNSFYWFPLLVFHSGWMHSISFEIFTRAKSKKFLAELLDLLGFPDKAKFEDFLNRLAANERELPTLGHNRLNPKTVVDIDELGMLP